MRDFHLNGILPPLTTPFDEEGNVDYESLRGNIERYNDAGLAGYVALGSNGEAVHLTQDERARVIETIRRAASQAHTLIAGVNEFSTRAAIESARTAADVGADAALVITPYFYKSQMTQAAFTQFFIEVADASPIPVLVYNVPQNTGVVIDSATIGKLAAHENIIGVKDSSGNMGAISDTIRLAPPQFKVMTGNGGILYPSLLMGATGAILAVACAAPRPCVDLYEAARAGDHARARELQNRIAPLSHIVTAGLGVAGLKAAMEMAGFIGGMARGPLAPLNDSDRARVKAVMRDTGLFSDFE
jgi:4-hydroxy-2-oxoglutarate aldolase